jgi:hypothetical protein
MRPLAPLEHLGRLLVHALDTLLRARGGVHVFSADPRCILRLANGRAGQGLLLAGGTAIAPGEPVIEMHLWNERLPVMPAGGADLAWAKEFLQRFTVSLRLLNAYLAAHSELNGARVLHGETGFLTTRTLDEGASLLVHLGFEVRRPRTGASPWKRFAEFWQNLYSWWLLWTYNPASCRGKTLRSLERCELWMSRATLARRYGT